MSWWTVASVAASFGLDFLEGLSNTSSRREEAKVKKRSVVEQLKYLEKEKDLVTQAYQQRRAIVTDMFGNKMENLADRVGFQLIDIGRQFDFGAGRTGFSYSGTIETNRKLETDKLKTGGLFEIRSLKDTLGRELMELDIWKASEYGRIDTERAKLRGERDVYEKIEKEKYLGLF